MVDRSWGGRGSAESNRGKTYLVEGQLCQCAELHLLLLRGVRGRPVCCEPVFQDVGGFLWKIASSLAVERVVVDTNMLLKSYVVVALLVTHRRLGTVWLVGIVH